MIKRSFSRLTAAWTRFWFVPQETSTLGVFRIAFGMVTTLWTISLLPDLFSFFGPEGIVPKHPSGSLGTWGLLQLSNSQGAVAVLFGLTLLASVALALGWHSRLAALVVLLGIISFEHRNPVVFNSGDALLRVLAFYCALTPCGDALSLDRLRIAPDNFWAFPKRAPWGMRLIQIQVSLLYFSTLWQKLQGVTWRDGTAVSFVLRIADIDRFPAPHFLVDSVTVAELLTFGTMIVELGLAVLVWNRAARPWVLSLGIALHLSIDYFVVIGFFSMIMITAYLAFMPPETATRGLLAVRDRVAGRWSRNDRRAIRAEGFS